jgi:hypothetical protein
MSWEDVRDWRKSDGAMEDVRSIPRSFDRTLAGGASVVI